MIFPLAGVLIGTVLGGLRARANKGSVADIIQWALVHGMIGGVLGLFVMIGIERSLI